MVFKQTRAPPSGADPSELAGTNIVTEDDVLHCKEVPTFNNSISKRDSELLLSFLTAPYIRIPLVLNFFAHPDRFMALNENELQHVIDCVMFEPGAWQSTFHKVQPTLIPSENRNHLATPNGLLFNELIYSSIGILKPVRDLLELGLDLDTGKYVSRTANIILYIIRLVTRIESYMIYAINHYQWDNMANKINSTQAESYIRGLKLNNNIVKDLKHCCKQIRIMLHRNIIPMIERWLNHSIKQEFINNDIIAILYTHLALIYQNIKYDDLNEEIVTTHLTAHLMINIRYVFKSSQINMKKNKLKNQIDLMKLGLSETEIFQMFQNNRFMMLKWLENNSTHSDQVMEAIVRVLTMTGTSKKRYDGLELTVREWRSLRGRNCAGRFVPAMDRTNNKSKENNNTTNQQENIKLLLDGEEESQDTEINIQLGDFTLKSKRVEVLNNALGVIDDVDFNQLFQGANMQCAEVKITTNRSWYRLVGRRHDIIQWQPYLVYPSKSKFLRPYGSKITEQWIVKALEPHRKRLLKNCELSLNKTYYSANDQIAHLAGYIYPNAKARERAKTKDNDDLEKQKDEQQQQQHDQNKINQIGQVIETKEDVELQLADYRNLKEIIVFRKRNVVHIYDIIEHGRRFYRSLIYTSDTRMCFRDMQPAIQRARIHPWAPYTRFASLAAEGKKFRYPNQSLIITRNLSSSKDGIQQVIPRRLLEGLLPAILLDEYEFWQNKDGSLTGYLKKEIQQKLHSSYILRIEYTKKDKSCVKVTRIAVKQDLMGHSSDYIIRDDEPSLILLNLLYTNTNSIFK